MFNNQLLDPKTMTMKLGEFIDFHSVSPEHLKAYFGRIPSRWSSLQPKGVKGNISKLTRKEVVVCLELFIHEDLVSATAQMLSIPDLSCSLTSESPALRRGRAALAPSQL